MAVLGSGVDRQTLVQGAQPLELVVIQGFTREIDDAFQKFNGRPEDFWRLQPQYIDTARKLDQILAGIQERQARS